MKARGGSIPARPLFCATFAAQEGFTLRKEFEVSPERGLVEVETLRDPPGGSVWLVSRWVSKDDFEVHKDWLARELGLQEAPRIAGLVVEVRRPRKPWWRRLPLYGIAMGTLGFFGALEVARSRYGLFFGPAEVEVRVGPGDEIHVGEGTPTVLSLSATNHSRVVTAVLRRIEADVLPSSVKDGEPVAEVRVPPKLGPVAPGGESKTDIRLDALPEAGDYNLRVRYEVSGGLFRPAEVAEVDLPLKVWPELEVGEPQCEAGSQKDQDLPRHIWAKLALRAGGQFDAGLDCFAELLRVPSVSFTGVTSASVGVEETDRETVDRPGAEVAYIQWRTSRMGPFERRDLLIGIRSDRPRADWERVLGQLDVKCFRRGGPS